MKDINILAIETSCDETAASVVKNGREVLSNVVFSQIDLHKKFGGVVPEIASRSHVEKLPGVVKAALENHQIDGVAITYAPGLVGALLTGVSYAKALAYALKKPLIPVHHIAGHICANYICHTDLQPPFLCLVVSGGHTQIVYVKEYTVFETYGQTRDDAAGEAIDKIARVLGLDYPGGVNLEKLAQGGDIHKYTFPRSFKNEDHLDFSFSGVKTAVINMLHKFDQKGETYKKEDVAASFLYNITDTLAINTFKCAQRLGINKIAIAGGVSANSMLRERFKKDGERAGCKLYIPKLEYCTDNGAMIASCGYYNYLSGRRAELDLNAIPGEKL